MFKSIFVLIVFLSISNLLAQEENQPETLFGGESHISGYGCPEVKFSQINGEWGIMVGGRGGVIVNKALSIGGAAYILTTSHKVDGYIPTNIWDLNKNIYLRTGYAGFFFEYINSSDKVIHFTINSLVGAGLAGYSEAINCKDCDDDDIWNDDRGNDWMKELSGYFIFEPGITVDMNVTTFFRISAGASYRFISGLTLPDPIHNKELSGPSINLAFKWGGF